MSDSIVTSVSMFLATDSITEVRALNCWDNNPEYKSTRIGYFDDAVLAAKAVEELESKWHPEGVYITLNPVRRDLLSRSANRIQKAKKNEATSDGDITCRRWLLIDFDPVRPAGISATESELYEAEEAARACVVWLQEQGWPEPFVMLSGNGYHALYRIDLPTDDGGLVKRCLAALSARFSNDKVHLDKKVFNAARITKLYGTLACKGDPTVDRPHRRSGLMEAPLVVEVVPVELLERLAGPAALPRSSSRSTSNDDDRLNVEKWLSRHGVSILARDQTNDGTDRWLIPCPRESAHTSANKTTDCCVTQSPSGELGGHCFHDSCGMANWQSLKAAIGPLEYEDYHDIPDTSSVDLSCLMTGTTAAQPDTVPPIPPELLNPGGLMQQVVDFNLRTAHKQQPELALAGAIALTATIIGRRVEDDYNTRPNIYLIGVGGSGCGKDHARKINKLLLAAVGKTGMLQDDLASSAGLHSALTHSPSTLLQLDEFGRMLATLSNPAKAPHLFSIVSVLLKIYSSSGSIYFGPSYGDHKENVTVHYPSCSVYGTTVSASLYNALTKESLTDGLLNRLLIFEASNNDPDPQTPQPMEVPYLIAEELRLWFTQPSGTPLICDPPARRLVTSPEAAVEFATLSTEARIHQREEQERGTAVWSRCYEAGRKLALIHQLSLNRNAEQISGDSARWGCTLALHLTSRIEQLAEAHVSDGQFDGIGKKLLRFVREGRGRERSRTEVCRHLRGLKNRELEELVTTEELIVGTRPSASGRAAITYRAT